MFGTGPGSPKEMQHPCRDYLMRLPDQDTKDIWTKMSPEEQAWYEDFLKATRYHDWTALDRLCEKAPTADRDRIYREINYELKAKQRAEYRVPKKHNSTYSEHDYAWAQPRSGPNVRAQIEYDYRGIGEAIKVGRKNEKA